MDLPVINAIWIGPRMGAIHAACLRSFLRTGHRVVLHTYGPVEDAPAGVELSDAGKLFPFDNVRLHKPSRSYSTAANLIRYEIQARGLGLYVDCDVYCYRPMPAREGYIFGWESDQTINNAVLQLPPGPLLEAMRSTGKRGWVPPWGHPAQQLLRRLHAPFRTIYDRGFGYSGPKALSWYARELGLDHLAEPPDVFYPVGFERVGLWTSPGLRLADIVTPRTHYVHLYHSQYRDELTPPDTIMAEIVAA